MHQALTIAGSDSSGGAGIQADVKTFAAHGVYAACAVTSVTAQNGAGVRAAFTIPAGIVSAQLHAIFDDLDIRAAKTGMLPAGATVEAVTEFFAARRIPLVVDPVMVSSSGAMLADGEAIETMKKKLLPLATLVTPNIAEAERLADMEIHSASDGEKAAKVIMQYGCANVLITGGHAAYSPATDILYDGTSFRRFSAPFISSKNTHGTGCVLSAAIAASLANGASLPDAVSAAKRFVTRAIERGVNAGRNGGAVNPFYFYTLDDLRHG